MQRTKKLCPIHRGKNQSIKAVPEQAYKFDFLDKTFNEIL